MVLTDCVRRASLLTYNRQNHPDRNGRGVLPYDSLRAATDGDGSHGVDAKQLKRVMTQAYPIEPQSDGSQSITVRRQELTAPNNP